MKANEGFFVGYNPQMAVDAGFEMTNSPTDHGHITQLSSDVKQEFGVDILETIADKGYECPEDHANALASGIVQNAIQRDGECTEGVKG